MLIRLLGNFIYSNFYTATALAALTLSSYYSFLNLSLRLYPVFCVFFGSWMLYNFHRLYMADMIDNDQLANRHKWLLNHAVFTKLIMGFSAFFLILMLPNYDVLVFVWLFPAVIVSIGYTIPFIPIKNTWWRFRDLPVLKPFIIAAVVTYLTLGFPVFEQLGIRKVFEPDILFLMLERFTFIIAVTLPFEIRDARGDKVAGLVTFASKYGETLVRLLSLLLIVIWVIFMFWRTLIFDLNESYLVMSLVVAVITSAGLYIISKPQNELLYAFAFEGAIIIYSLSLIGLGE